MARARLREDVRCPECGVAMYERKRKNFGDESDVSDVLFFGCLRFPLCVGTRPSGESGRVDSYTDLLRKAYLRALQCLSQPRFLGNDARAWLLTKGLCRELTPGDLQDKVLPVLSNPTLEKAIDAACEYVQERGSSADFLVEAHEERMARIRPNLPGVFSFDIAHKPPPLIVRRYDTSQVEQLEARLGPSPAAATHGKHCPRCGSWSEELDTNTITGPAFVFRDIGTYDCPTCGKFHTSYGSFDEVTFEYDSDKGIKQVPGITLGYAKRSEKS